MYILQRDNVVKIAETETQRDLLKSKGFAIPGDIATEIELQSAVLGFAKENEELRKHIENQNAEIANLKKMFEESKSQVPEPENSTSDVTPSDQTANGLDSKEATPEKLEDSKPAKK